VKPISTLNEPFTFTVRLHTAFQQIYIVHLVPVFSAFQLHVFFCLFVLSRQYRCNLLPGKTRLRNDCVSRRT